MRRFRVYGLTCLLAFAAASVVATTIILPTDEQLISKSPVIVAATVVRSGAVARQDAIWTESVLSVDRVFKGNVGGEITVAEIGGEIDGRISKVFGAPQYIAGQRVLAFLTPTPRGDYQTVDLFVGKFDEQRTLSGMRVWNRDDVSADAVLLDPDFRPIRSRNVQRDAAAFERYITARLAGHSGANNYGVENPLLERDVHTTPPLHRAAPEFTLISEPSIYRWFAFDRGNTVRWFSYGSQPGYTGGGVNEAQAAMGVWTGYSAANIRYSYAGTGSGSPAGLMRTNGVNEILFNDPLQEIAGSWNPNTGGVVGQGGFNGVAQGGNWTSPFTADAGHTQGTFHAYEITEANLTIQDGVAPNAGVSSATLAEIVAHEFGHTLGLGHSADPTALMWPSVTGRGASLRADDQAAARWLYPSGTGSTPTPTPTPTPGPTVPTAPSNLSGSTSGTNILIQWSDNASNETGQYIYVAAGSGAFARIGDAGPSTTSATITGASAGTYRVYVTAYNSAGESAPSNTISVTVQTAPPPVTAPAAGFTVSPSSGVAGSTNFQFTDLSSGAITSRLWQFGDGWTSADVNPTHVFANAGNYTVILTVSNSGGSAQAARAVSVAAPAPVIPNVAAEFDFGPSSPNVGDVVRFNDRSSGSPTAWSWSFGDGTNSNAQNPTHAYATPGSYLVSVTAYNSVSAGTATRSITVNPYAPYRSLISASAQTNGVGGSVWRTELTIFNAGSEAASGQLIFIPGAGGSILTRAIFLAPKQAVTYGNALPDIFGLPSGVGAIAIETTSPFSTPNLKLTSRTYTTGGSGTYGQGVPNVTTNLQPTTYLTGLEADADFRTNLGVVNRSDAPVALTMTLYDGEGNVVGTSSSSVPPNNFQQGSLAAYFPASANRPYSALSMRADAAVANAISVYASVIDNHTQDPTYVQAVPLPTASSSIVPAVGRTGGANGTFWRSDVRIFNPNPSPLFVNLRYLGASLPVSVAARRTVLLPDIVTRMGMGNGTGALQIDWNGGTPLITTRTYTTVESGGTYGQSIDPVQSFSSDSAVPGLRSDASFRSNVGLVNASDNTIGVTATLLSPSGQSLASAFVQVAPKSQAQYSLAGLFPGINVASLGSVTLLAHTDDGPVLLAYGSMVDNASGDPVFFAGQ